MTLADLSAWLIQLSPTERSEFDQLLLMADSPLFALIFGGGATGRQIVHAATANAENAEAADRLLDIIDRRFSGPGRPRSPWRDDET
jgi:hypothetical protein